ncbi:MAG: NapC/NirT family cytochrome c [Sideroxydans sp.]|nr:NapC/NirT family cytochrome c [Sideroxydans sp.]
MDKNLGMIERTRNFLCKPSAKYSVLAIAVVSIFLGVILWGGFNTGMEATNEMAFCISCHEMSDNIYPEYKKTVHFSNRVGVRAICSDCHVPKSWGYKLLRKIEASRELWGKVVGHVSTKEKFESHRMEMATREWARMKASDSRECRNCHTFDAMRVSVDKQAVYAKHMKAKDAGKTCIDCHKGIAHLLPREYVDPDEE